MDEFTLGGFTKYDPTLTPPAFSDDSRIEIKIRSGTVQTCYSEPWALVGWNHTGGQNDILEFRLIRGSMTHQKPAEAKLSEIENDARIFCGLPPHRSWSNTSQGDAYFDASCRGKYGDAAWAAEVKRVVEREDEIRRNSEAMARVDEIAARRGLPVRTVGRDPNVELRGLLKEAIDVLHCHHRNTHKDLITRLRNYRSKL